MQNYIQKGDSITITAAASAIAGAPVVLEDRVGVSESTVAVGEDQVVLLEGVVELDKDSTKAFTVGEKLYWDVGDAALTDDDESTTNKPIGWSADAYATGTTSAYVKLGAW